MLSSYVRLRTQTVLTAIAIILSGSTSARAANYYLGSAASAQGGIVIADIAALNAIVLQPGDRVAFQGGESFAGTIALNPEDSGTTAQPVVFTSYGSGRATITAGSGQGFKIYNAAGFSVSNLDLVGSGASLNRCSGIDAGVYLPDSTKLDYLHFDQMKISGFYNGVEIWSWYS